MRIITKLQYFTIIIFSIALTSCTEDDPGTGIPEVDVTRELIIGEWSLESLKISDSDKTGNVNGEDVEFQYTLENIAAVTNDRYLITFSENGGVTESGNFDDAGERVLATFNQDRLFVSRLKDTDPNVGADVLVEYSSIFYDDALMGLTFEITEDNKSIIVNGGPNGQLTLDVTFFANDQIRFTYPVLEFTPFFGASNLTLPTDELTTDPENEPGRRIIVSETDTVIGNDTKPTSGNLIVILNKI